METTKDRRVRVDELLLGDTIVERSGKKLSQYKVTSVLPAACDVNHTHVEVDRSRSWCYDSAQVVTAR